MKSIILHNILEKIDFIPKGFRKFSVSFVMCLLMVTVFALPAFTVQAQGTAVQTLDNLPSINVSDPGFKLTVCDGPEGARPRGDTKYVACDFNGLMKQAQHIINIAIVVGILVAIIGFCYAGILMISGIPGNIKKAKDIFPKIFYGFIIMLSAWFIVYELLRWLTGNSGFSALLGTPL